MRHTIVFADDERGIRRYCKEELEAAGYCVFLAEDGASYQGALTDAYLQAIVEARSTIIYRLGESIEHAAHKQYVRPHKGM